MAGQFIADSSKTMQNWAEDYQGCYGNRLGT